MRKAPRADPLAEASIELRKVDDGTLVEPSGGCDYDYAESVVHLRVALLSLLLLLFSVC